MKHLFDEKNERLTTEGCQVMAEFDKAIEVVFSKFCGDDFSVRDMSAIAHGSVEKAAAREIMRGARPVKTKKELPFLVVGLGTVSVSDYLFVQKTLCRYAIGAGGNCMSMAEATAIIDKTTEGLDQGVLAKTQHTLYCADAKDVVSLRDELAKCAATIITV